VAQPLMGFGLRAGLQPRVGHQLGFDPDENLRGCTCRIGERGPAQLHHFACVPGQAHGPCTAQRDRAALTG